MNYIFALNSSLAFLPDISNWTVSNVTNMSSIFYKCNSLKYLKLSIPRSVKIIGTEIFGAAGGFIVFR